MTAKESDVPVNLPPVCDYENSDYQTSFWDEGQRNYEDQVEAIALQRLLPAQGSLLLELGAGAGRNTPRYAAFSQIVLLDYSLTQLQQAQNRLINQMPTQTCVYVAANAYRLPFISGVFDTATMIRVLHHLVDARLALQETRRVLKPEGIFILEFANKQNLKSIFRYLFRLQGWSPYSLDPVEFVKLNYNFHPKQVRLWLEDCGFLIQRCLTVSHFRLNVLKRLLPIGILTQMDAFFQSSGSFIQVSPSVFFKAKVKEKSVQQRSTQLIPVESLFACPLCGNHPLINNVPYLTCSVCAKQWLFQNGIYDFRV